MFLSESEFQSRFGKLYDENLKKFQFYLDNPQVLQKEIDLENAKIAAAESFENLPAPAPNKFAFRTMHYRGLVKNKKRLQNFIVAQQEENSIERISLPTRLDIEPISQCNFRCVMCQVSGWEGGKRAQNMSLADFKHLVEEQYGLVEVKLQGFGEPLMHKEYVEMIEHLVSKDIWVRTTVNGSLLHMRDNYKRLIDSGLGDCNISVDGATKEVFEKIRRKSDFDTVKKNLKMFNDYAEKQGKFITMMWVVLQKNNRHQIFEFVELAKELNFKRLTFSCGLSDWGQDQWRGNNQELQVQTLNQSELERLFKISAESDLKITYWDLRAKYDKNDKKNLCVWPFKWGFVGSDLRMSPCCMIGNPDVVDMGDAKNLTATWNGPALKEFRQKHLSGDIPKVCQGCYKNFQ